MSAYDPPEPELISELRRLADRRLSAAEFDAYVHAPFDQEREEKLAMIRWFTRRYPTPGDRLAYNRRSWRDIATRLPPGA